MMTRVCKGWTVGLLLASLAGVARSTSDGSTESLFGGYFHHSTCSTPYALAADSYNLQTLAAAIKAAGLVDVLDTTTSEITVFVPTDDAFAALADTLHMTLEDLLAESNLLSVILEYHVYAEDAYTASDLKKHDTLVTEEGEAVKVKTVGDIMMLEAAAGSTATVLVADLSACKAVVHIIDTILIPKAAATALGVEMVDVKQADQKDSLAVHGILSKKKTAATPVPTETVLVPVTTVPAVAVSGARVASPVLVPTPTVLVAETPANIEKPKLLGGLLNKKTLNSFPTPEPTPKETPAPDTPTLKELLKNKTPAATPVETVLVPVATTVPAVAVSGARDVPMATPATVPAAPAVVTEAPTSEKPLDGLLKKKELVWNTFTPVATQKPTPKPSLPTFKELVLKATPPAEKKMPAVIGKGLVSKPTPVPTVLVPAVTIPAVPVSGARVVASPPVVEVPVSSIASESPDVQPVEVMPIREAVAPAVERVGEAVQERREAIAPTVARVGAAVGSAVEARREAVAPARAAVAQAATDVVDRRRAMLSPAVEALDGPAVDTAMAPQMVPMAPMVAPMMAPMTAPMAAMAPSVQALQGPDMMMMESSTPMMAPIIGPMMAPMMAPQTAPQAAMAPAVVALAGPNTMEAPAMAPGMGGFDALEALKTRSSSPCATVIEAAMMVPELSTFVATAQAANLSDYLNDPNLVATVFVPTNDAFTKALSQYGVTPAQALQQTSLVRGLLQYHVVPGMAMTVDTLTNGQTLTTALSGQTLKVNKTGASVTIQPATSSAANLVEADVPVCKATMDVIDSLLFASVSSLPPSAASQLAARTAGR